MLVLAAPLNRLTLQAGRDLVTEGELEMTATEAVNTFLSRYGQLARTSTSLVKTSSTRST